MDINPRKKLHQFGIRPGMIRPAWTLEHGSNAAGYANGHGATLGLMDESEPDRPNHLVVRTTDEAFAIMELMARFINERDKLDAAKFDALGQRVPFHYQSLEVDRLDSGETSCIHVRFDNRDEGFHSYPNTSRHMSVPYRIFKIMRAAMSRIP